MTELPGVEREDVDVELVGNELTITGEVKAKERTGVVRRRCRFEYRISLPEQIKAEEVDASLADGVLKLRVPKSERAQWREDRAQGFLTDRAQASKAAFGGARCVGQHGNVSGSPCHLEVLAPIAAAPPSCPHALAH